MNADLALSSRLNRVFAARHRHGEPEQTNEDVAVAVTRVLGRRLDCDEIAAIRDGENINPTPEVLAALAAHFNLQAASAYLTANDPAERELLTKLDRQFRLMIAYRDSRVEYTALRAGDLGPEAIEDLIRLIESVAAERDGDDHAR